MLAHLELLWICDVVDLLEFRNRYSVLLRDFFQRLAFDDDVDLRGRTEDARHGCGFRINCRRGDDCRGCYHASAAIELHGEAGQRSSGADSEGVEQEQQGDAEGEGWEPQAEQHLVPLLVQKYGVDVGGDEGRDFDQIASFRRFLLFARDTIRWKKPMEPDIHWSAMSGHVSTFILNGGRYDKIFYTENFDAGMQGVLDAVQVRHPVDLALIPKFNESEGHGPKRLHPVADYFDDLSMHLVWEIYKRDFQLFKYDFDNPNNKMPLAEVDLAEVHAKLGD